MACERCGNACLYEDHVETMTGCMRLTKDCADTCRLAVALMSRGSALVGDVALLCATACERCAVECSRHKEAHCRACAEACRRCAELCRVLAA